jgi:hypothetical protein
MEGNQQDSLLRVNREVGDPPEGRVKFEGASQGYEFSSEESEGEETNREVEDNPPDSSSPKGRVKFEGASQGYEFSSEESDFKFYPSLRTTRIRGSSLTSLLFSSPSDSSLENSYP